MTQDQQSEPPSWLRPPLFMVGQDSRGNWVVQDQKGMRGGLFVNREAALRYVRSENGFKPQAVVMVSGGIELEIISNAGAFTPRQKRVGFCKPASDRLISYVQHRATRFKVVRIRSGVADTVRR